jgi:hypothetical protein
MATTTATVSISSSNLQPGNNLSINASHTLTKSGTTAGLEIIDVGRGILTEASAADALAEALGTADTSNWIYLCNKSTNDLHYIKVGIHDTLVGHLGAGEWLWMPWNQGDSDAELNIEAEGVTGSSITYEYAIFQESKTLPAKT